jgi:hypothetical protein
MKTWGTGFVAAVLCVCGSQAFGAAYSAAAIINNWTPTPSPINGVNNVVWSAVGDQVHADANHTGALMSDFATVGDFTFSGTMTAVDLADNDTMGFVFNFQDSSNNYRLSFAGGSSYTSTKEHYGVVVVREVAGSDTYLASDDYLEWTPGVTYDFSVTRQGQTLDILLSDASGTIFTANLNDSTFTSGRVGLQVYGQETNFSDIHCSVVPEPGGMFIWSLLGLMLAAARVKFRRRPATP